MPAYELHNAGRCSKANSMYTINETNSLYFFPHKLTFEPLQEATDSEKRNRWFPGSDASVVQSRIQSLRQPSLRVTKIEPSKIDDDNRGIEGGDGHMKVVDGDR